MDFNIVYKNLKNAINTTSIPGSLGDKLGGITDIGLTFSSTDETTWNNLINTPGTVLNEGQYVISSAETYLKLAEGTGAPIASGIYSSVETYLKLAEAGVGFSLRVYPYAFGINLNPENIGFNLARPIKTGNSLFRPSLEKIINTLNNEFQEFEMRILDKGVIEGGRKVQQKYFGTTQSLAELWTTGIPDVLSTDAASALMQLNPDSFQNTILDPGVIEVTAQDFADFSILPRFYKDFSIEDEGFIDRLIDKGIVINYYSAIGLNGVKAQKYSIYSVDTYIDVFS